MKTTLDLPDSLFTEVKMRAAKENRKMKDVIAEALRRGLGAPASSPPPHELLEAYHAKGGLDSSIAKKWMAEIRADRKTWRRSSS